MVQKWVPANHVLAEVRSYIHIDSQYRKLRGRNDAPIKYTRTQTGNVSQCQSCQVALIVCDDLNWTNNLASHNRKLPLIHCSSLIDKSYWLCFVLFIDCRIDWWSRDAASASLSWTHSSEQRQQMFTSMTSFPVDAVTSRTVVMTTCLLLQLAVVLQIVGKDAVCDIPQLMRMYYLFQSDACISDAMNVLC